MNRDELIEKAVAFMAATESPQLVIQAAEKFADFVLSLQEPESKPWPQKGDIVHFRSGHGRVESGIYGNAHIDDDYLKQGHIHRTEAEAIRANEVEAANAAIKRWRDENAPFVADYTNPKQAKYHGMYEHCSDQKGWRHDAWVTVEIPGIVVFETLDDLARCQSEIPDAWAALVGVK